MNSIVKELQYACLKADNALTELHRKAYLIAAKLNIQSFKDWVQNELKGYPHGEAAPNYRSVYCELMTYNNYYGWIPIVIGDPKAEMFMKESEITQPISEIENLNQKDASYSQFTI